MREQKHATRRLLCYESAEEIEHHEQTQPEAETPGNQLLFDWQQRLVFLLHFPQLFTDAGFAGFGFGWGGSGGHGD